MASHETLGLLLVRDGVISRPQLYDALRLQRQNGRLLGTCLLTLGYVQPQTLLDILARQLAIPALPPGTLGRALPAAVSKVPAEVAMRLRVVPYSWDGEMLGVAVADGRALNHLHEVAFHSQSAVGAYVALEMEIEAVLRTIYPGARTTTTESAASPGQVQLVGRPRPARAEPAAEVPTRDFGQALGLEEGAGAPVLLADPKAAGVPARPTISGAPPMAPQPTPQPPTAATAPHADATMALERLSFYDAVEQVYQGQSVLEVGACIGRALLNYFARVLIVGHEAQELRVLGFGGIAAPPERVSLEALPATAQALAHRSIAYGKAGSDPRTVELQRAFELGEAASSLVAPVSDGNKMLLLVYADNGADPELYDDLHDVELLFKEAETAVGLLRGTS